MFSSANNQVFRVGLRAALLLLVSIGVSVGLSLFVQGAEQIAHAAENRTFIISAYYSPLPDQQKYVTGSYAGDIRLNGNGTHGADGTPVYPGMIAAPKTYDFGTKMHIPGIGTVAVHDRGGAIVTSGERGNAHDRLDVWMGYGDDGLQRALQWGKRTVDVVVYGVDPSVQERVELAGYSPSKGVTTPEWLDPNIGGPDEDSLYVEETSTPVIASTPVVHTDIFSRDLSLGSSGEDVSKLQNMLKELGHYNGEAHGTFDTATYEAVSNFQLSESIIGTRHQYGSGYVGPKTIAKLASKNVSSAAHAKADVVALSDVFNTNLKFGDSGEDVRQLQEELRKVNLLGIEPTGYYGKVTEHAVFKFQQSQKLVGDKESNGAGIFGPITRSKLNSIVGARLESDRLKTTRQEA